MTVAEKRWTRENLITQKLKIIVGTRSSVFLPIQNLSTIIVDEEHDASYKQSEGMPTYNARDIAIMRAKNLNIPVILGSATPSIESYYNSSSGKYNFYELSHLFLGRNTIHHIVVLHWLFVTLHFHLLVACFQPLMIAYKLFDNCSSFKCFA